MTIKKSPTRLTDVYTTFCNQQAPDPQKTENEQSEKETNQPDFKQLIKECTESLKEQELIQQLLDLWDKSSFTDLMDGIIDKEEQNKDRFSEWLKDNTEISDRIEEMNYVEDDSTQKKSKFSNFFEVLLSVKSCSKKMVRKTVYDWLLNGIELEELKFYESGNPMFQLINSVNKDFLIFCHDNYQLINFFLESGDFMTHIIAVKDKFFLAVTYIWNKINDLLISDYLNNQIKNF